MTNEEIRELYLSCYNDAYFELDYETDNELSDWELREIFRPTINQMFGLGYETEDIEAFVMFCDYHDLMSDTTYYALANEYNLDLSDESDGKIWYGRDIWDDCKHEFKIKELNSPNKELKGRIL